MTNCHPIKFTSIIASFNSENLSKRSTENIITPFNKLYLYIFHIFLQITGGGNYKIFTIDIFGYLLFKYNHTKNIY